MMAAVNEDREELVIRPAAHEITGTEFILHSLRHHAQDRVAGRGTVGSSKVRQTINLNENDAKRQMVAGETGKILPQMKLGELMIGDGSGVIDASVFGQSVPVAGQRNSRAGSRTVSMSRRI